MDPIIYPGQSPYSYCYNNPTNFVDPSGLFGLSGSGSNITNWGWMLMKRLFAGGWGSHAADLGLEPSYQVEGESVDLWVAQAIIGSGAADWEASQVGRRVPGHWVDSNEGKSSASYKYGYWYYEGEWHYGLIVEVQARKPNWVWVPDLSPIHGDRILGELGGAPMYPVAKGLIQAYEGTKNYVSDVVHHPFGTPTADDIDGLVEGISRALDNMGRSNQYIGAVWGIFQELNNLGEVPSYWGYSCSKYQALPYLWWGINFPTP